MGNWLRRLVDTLSAAACWRALCPIHTALWLWTSSLCLLSKQHWSFNLPAGDGIIYKVNGDSGCSPVACSSPRLSSRFSFWLVRDGRPFFTGSLKVPSWSRESSRLGRFTRMLEHFTYRYPCDKTAWRPVICSIKKMWGAPSCWGRRKLLSARRICVWVVQHSFFFLRIKHTWS